MNCTLCNHNSLELVYTAKNIPIFQNKVFESETEAWEAIRIADIRPCKNVYSGAVHRTNQLKMLLKPVLPVGGILLGKVFEPAIPAQPHARWHVLEPRIVFEFLNIVIGVGIKHGERRHLPGTILGEAIEKRLRLFLVVRN